MDLQGAMNFCTTASLIVPTLLVAVFVAEIALPEPKPEEVLGAAPGGLDSKVNRWVAGALKRKLDRTEDPEKRATLERAIAELGQEEDLRARIEQSDDPEERNELMLALAALDRDGAGDPEKLAAELEKERRASANAVLWSVAWLIVAGVLGEGFALLGSVNLLNPRICAALTGTSVMLVVDWLAQYAWTRMSGAEALAAASPKAVAILTSVVRKMVTLCVLAVSVILWVRIA